MLARRESKRGKTLDHGDLPHAVGAYREPGRVHQFADQEGVQPGRIALGVETRLIELGQVLFLQR